MFFYWMELDENVVFCFVRVVAHALKLKRQQHIYLYLKLLLFHVDILYYSLVIVFEKTKFILCLLLRIKGI